MLLYPVKAQTDRDSALDQIGFGEIRITALQSANADLQSMVVTQQQKIAELEQLATQRSDEARDAARSQQEAMAQLQRVMDQLISAQTAGERAKKQVKDSKSTPNFLAAEHKSVH